MTGNSGKEAVLLGEVDDSCADDGISANLMTTFQKEVQTVSPKP